MLSRLQMKEDESIKKHRFLIEVCKKHCNVCGRNVDPAFCSYIFEADPINFIHKILAPIIIMHRTEARFKDKLLSYAGFQALFCSVRSKCVFRNDKHTCRFNLDCYMNFLRQQGGMPEHRPRVVRDDKHKKDYIECTEKITNFERTFRTGMKPRKRKKLHQALKRVSNIYRDLNGAVNTKKSKKKVTTKFFCRWPDKIDPIFDKGEATECASKSEAV